MKCASRFYDRRTLNGARARRTPVSHKFSNLFGVRSTKLLQPGNTCYFAPCLFRGSGRTVAGTADMLTLRGRSRLIPGGISYGVERHGGGGLYARDLPDELHSRKT